MTLTRVALFAALLAVAFAMSSSSTTTGGIATLGNFICAFLPNGLKSVKIQRVQNGETCDDGFPSFRKRDMNDAVNLMRSLQPELFDSTSEPLHPFVHNLLGHIARHRQRQTVNSLTLHLCEQGSYCDDSTSTCVTAIATGSSGCSDDVDCADYQDGYTGVNCVSSGSGKSCLVTEVYGAGESGCSTNSDDPNIDGNGCLNNDCVSGSCAAAAISESCFSDEDCVYGEAYCDGTDVCAAIVGEGQSCTDNNECGDGLLICAGQPAVCTKFLSVGVGGSCADPDGETSPLGVCQADLICDRTTKKCIQPENEGKSCTTQADCGDGTICAKSFYNCDQVCISSSLQSLIGQKGVDAAVNFFTCLGNNKCATPAAWKDNCAGTNCLSESAKYSNAVENTVLGAAGAAASIVVPILAMVALVVAML